LDPEQVYQDVLQEEQAKGVSPPVAEGRAKAARVRAEHGSPHPKEARWWPGSQPQFEGGDAAEPAEVEAEPAAEEIEQPAAAEAPAEQPAAEAPAEQPAAEAPAEQPAAQAPAEQPAAEAPAEQPAAQAPAEQPAAQAPAEQPAAQAPAAAAAPSEQPAQAQQPAAAIATVEATAARGQAATVGVQPGVPAGNRLRPEDAVSTQAQFDGQRAMEQRRKLIDELVATGVPAVTAAETGRERSPWISILFLVVPLIAVLLIVSNSENLGGQVAATGGGEPASGGGGTPEDTVVAEQTAFNTDTIMVKAGEPASITFDNKDPFDHNIAIYENPSDADAQANAIFQGDHISASTTTYEFEAPPKGEYIFQCDLHPTTMNGTVVVE
jgi:plastocyanin